MNETVQLIANTLSSLGTTVKDIVTQAAALVGETAMHLYGVLVRQQIVKGVQSMIIAVALGAGGILAYRTAKKISREKRIHQVDKWFLYVFLGAITVLAAWRAIEFINLGLPYLVNPEYQAIMEAAKIIESLK